MARTKNYTKYLETLQKKLDVLKNFQNIYRFTLSETSCQGLFNQIHGKLANKRLFLPGRVYFPLSMGYNINGDKENLSFKE